MFEGQTIYLNSPASYYLNASFILCPERKVLSNISVGEAELPSLLTSWTQKINVEKYILERKQRIQKEVRRANIQIWEIMSL